MFQIIKNFNEHKYQTLLEGYYTNQKNCWYKVQSFQQQQHKIDSTTAQQPSRFVI